MIPNLTLNFAYGNSGPIAYMTVESFSYEFIDTDSSPDDYEDYDSDSSAGSYVGFKRFSPIKFGFDPFPDPFEDISSDLDPFGNDIFGFNNPMDMPFSYFM
ncbi:hypothetical protein CDAR_70171 [Caerostris darwini]|uniref:Uncharacterized protein n=1 Tax=Caerostris darwini TaxID=1538125 RepID=A0AAV4NTZ6_9ARAC|nr:hypothetical protein CDAR_70171 [Caerostris darwini]